MIKACIFDLDGVIVDTAKYHFVAWRRLANQLGFDFTEKENEQLKGVSRVESLNQILRWGKVTKNEEEKATLAAMKNAWYVELISNMDAGEILDGVVPFLEELKAKGIKIALGSASKNSMTILRQIELLPYFDAVIDGTKTTRSKPDPEVFLLGAQALGVPPSECIVFEDAEKGVEAALAGGFWAVGIGEAEVLQGAHFVMPGFKNVRLNDIVSHLNG